jgi:hypothetical protein
MKPSYGLELQGAFSVMAACFDQVAGKWRKMGYQAYNSNWALYRGRSKQATALSTHHTVVANIPVKLGNGGANVADSLFRF